MILDLTPYKWRNRLLLIFAPSEASEDYAGQRRLLDREKAGFKDRDLLPGFIFEDETGTLDSHSITPEEAARLRKIFGVPDGEFTVVLVGKDGGEKFRSRTPVSPEDIFDRIDEMPIAPPRDAPLRDAPLRDAPLKRLRRVPVGQPGLELGGVVRELRQGLQGR